MYQLAPDEERRDCGLNVLDTYFNNGVRFCLTNPFKINCRMICPLFILFDIELKEIAGPVLLLREDTDH